MDAPATAPVFALEDARSPAPPQTAILSRADPRHRPHVVPVDVAPLRARGGDVVYTESSTGRVAGFAERARDPGPEAPGDGDGAGDKLATAADAFVGMPLAEVERLVIEATIRACGGSLPKAARVLGVSPSTLYRKRAGWTDQSDDP
jgi:transcriptional regulator with GAF, ATPase, and Fis domain